MRSFNLISLVTCVSVLSPPRGGGAAESSPAQPPAINSPAQVTVTIDGNADPTLIPDDVAYLHFFRALAKNRSADPVLEERRRASYLRYFFKRDCGATRSEDRSLGVQQTVRLLAATDKLEERLAAIDAQLATGKLLEHFAAEQRRLFVLNAVDSLPVSVDSDAATKVRNHVLDHVKRHIQLITASMPAPPTAAVPAQ